MIMAVIVAYISMIIMTCSLALLYNIAADGDLFNDIDTYTSNGWAGFLELVAILMLSPIIYIIITLKVGKFTSIELVKRIKEHFNGS